MIRAELNNYITENKPLIRRGGYFCLQVEGRRPAAWWRGNLLVPVGNQLSSQLYLQYECLFATECACVIETDPAEEVLSR